MKLEQIITAVRDKYPDSTCKPEGYSRYGIYSGKNRVDGWSCLTERSAWTSCYRVLNKQRNGKEDTNTRGSRE